MCLIARTRRAKHSRHFPEGREHARDEVEDGSEGIRIKQTH